jgi:phenylacetate-CoA ligase
VLKSKLTSLFWQAQRLRDNRWAGRDCRLDRAVIAGQMGIPPGGRRVQGWGLGFDEQWSCGITSMLDLLHADVATQVFWLEAVRPTYLGTYPSNLAALLDIWEAEGIGGLKLDQVICQSEMLLPGLAERCERVLGAKMLSNYSTGEMGYITIECPDCGQQHVQDEGVYVEVLDDDGRPCGVGETGRVAVTLLHNFAMPLIRYEIGDYAEVGRPCSAGRGLSSLGRILGRRRNMLVLPDGSKRWPTFGSRRFAKIAAVEQFQLVQQSVGKIEARFRVGEPLTAMQRDALAVAVGEALGYPFEVEITEFSGPIPRSRRGKFEEFISNVA